MSVPRMLAFSIDVATHEALAAFRRDFLSTGPLDKVNMSELIRFLLLEGIAAYRARVSTAEQGRATQ